MFSLKRFGPTRREYNWVLHHGCARVDTLGKVQQSFLLSDSDCSDVACRVRNITLRKMPRVAADALAIAADTALTA